MGFLDNEATTLESEVQEHVKSGAPEQPPPAAKDRAPKPTAFDEPTPGAAENEDGEVGGQARDQAGKFVPHAALHEERTKRQAAEKRLSDLEETQRARNEVVDRRLALLAQADTPPPAPAAPAVIPDIDTDPIGHFRARAEQQDRELKDFHDWRKAQETGQQQVNQQVELANWARTQADSFITQTPDYLAAENHALAMRRAELGVLGLAPHAIQQAISQDVAQIAMEARQQGKNPAEVIYQLAMARGYQKAAVPQNPVDTSRVDTIQRGQALGTSIDQAGGAAPAQAPKLSAEWLLNCSEDEFLAAIKSKEGRKALGR